MFFGHEAHLLRWRHFAQTRPAALQAVLSTLVEPRTTTQLGQSSGCQDLSSDAYLPAFHLWFLDQVFDKLEETMNLIHTTCELIWACKISRMFYYTVDCAQHQTSYTCKICGKHREYLWKTQRIPVKNARDWNMFVSPIWMYKHGTLMSKNGIHY